MPPNQRPSWTKVCFFLTTVNLWLGVNSFDFDIHQDGDSTYGHVKIPNTSDPSGSYHEFDFLMNQVNETTRSVSVGSIPNGSAAWPNLTGLVTLVENGSEQLTRGQLAASQVRLSFESKLTFHSDGYSVAGRAELELPGPVKASYSVKSDSRQNCWPLMFNQSLTTVPADLLSYQSYVEGYCNDKDNHQMNPDQVKRVKLQSRLDSNHWSWLSFDINQFWVFNTTGGYESMNATLNSLGVVNVTADWVDVPLSKKIKTARFISATPRVPSFQLKYLVDGSKKTLIYEPDTDDQNEN